MDLREPARTFRDLIVWQEAHQFVLGVYRATAGFPKHEIYGLSSQFRSAAVSIAANIAEGFKRHSHLEKIRFLNIAQGSAEECRYYALLAQDLGYVETGQLQSVVDKVSFLLDRYLRGIERRHGA
jgi:four helix bundle protein